MLQLSPKLHNAGITDRMKTIKVNIFTCYISYLVILYTYICSIITIIQHPEILLVRKEKIYIGYLETMYSTFITFFSARFIIFKIYYIFML